MHSNLDSFGKVLLPLLLLTGFSQAAFGQGEFKKAVYYSVGQSPVSVAAADFNGDGSLDLAVANGLLNENSNTISVLLGNGDGTFQDAVDYAAGNTPFSVAVGDLNGDGKPDLAVADFSLNTLSVLLGNGDGSFQPPVSYTAGPDGTRPLSITAVDLNGDGKLDLAVSNDVSQTLPGYVSVLLGNGDGTFGTPTNYSAGIFPQSITAADFNGDGKPDLAAASLYSGYVSVLLGNGDGTFQAAVNYAGGNASESLAVGDFNADGNMDLVAASFAPVAGSGLLDVLLGNGDGTFQSPVTYGVGAFDGTSVAVADFNNDGNLDIAGSQGGGGVSVLLGAGDGTFYPSPSSYTTTSSGGVAVGDFNGDGMLDIAETNGLNDTVAVLLNQGNSPLVTLSTDGLRFGGVKLGTTSPPQKATVTNTGFSELIVSSITVTGDYLEKNTCGTSLAIQASCTITVQFRPRGSGLRTGEVTILDNARPPGQVIHLRGFGVE